MKLAVYWYLLGWTTIIGYHSVISDFSKNLSASSINTTLTTSTRRPGIKASTGRRQSLLMRARLPYYYPDDPYRIHRRQYRVEDFLWAGSGDGPTSENNADGMAWEDGTALSGGTSAIKVTKTMVLYKTVLSTIYPVAMTPIVVTSRIKATPSLTGSISVTLLPSPSFVPSSQDYTDLMTPSFTPVFVQPTVTFPGSVTPGKEPDDSGESSESLHDKLSAASADIRYWIQTTIKTKRSTLEHPNDVHFQESMQSRLARIYAAAFKRQLLNSLGIMGEHGRRINGTHSQSSNPGRKRRSSSSTSSRHSLYMDVDGVGVGHNLHYSDSARMARTAMNVTVAMVNVTWSEPVDLIVMKYVVYAEGTPVPGFVAVKELRMVTKEEMENKLIGYEVVNKAEALVQPLESYQTGVSPMPWLMALVVLVCLMILILILTMLMAYKWKQNRLRGIREGSPSHAEGGVANLVFPAPEGPSRADYAQERQSGQGRQLSLSSRSPASSHFRVDTAEESGVPGRSTVAEETQQAATESSDQQFATSDDKSSGSRLIGPNEGSYSSPRRYKSKPMGVTKKASKRKRKRRKSHIMSLDDQQYTRSSRKFRDEVLFSTEGRSTGKKDKKEEEDDFALATDICRNMEKISYGNLDICPESLARTPSAQAKKIIDSRPSSHEQKRSSGTAYFEEPIENQEGPTGTDTQEIQPVEGDDESSHEQDRELSERSFEITDSASVETTSRKDAEVQTPTRLGRKSPRVRTSPRHRTHGKSSKASMLSTESHESVQFHHLHSSGEEPNPLGRMRKRFHQFLDDAFNVMASGGKRDSVSKAPQSARVTVSHHVKTKSPGRPWTSHIIREESVRKIRPKSSVILGPPKPAWTIASERRCQSAKSKSQAFEEGYNDPKNRVEECIEDVDGQKEHLMSSRSSSITPRTDGQHCQSDSSKALIFPKYPTYPEVDICLENDPNRTAMPGPSHSRRSKLHPKDPAVPLIEAIKDEMKRFERVKVSATHDPDSSKT